MKQYLLKISEIINKAISIFSGIFLGVVFALVFLNVVLRYLFHSGLAWSEELSRYMFICMVVTGMVSVTQKRDHFFVDILINRLHGVVRKIILFIQNAVVVAMLWIMGYGSLEMSVMNLINHSPVLAIPMW